MDIKEYITKNFDDNIHWFEEEVNRPYHARRISHAISTIHYLKGIHNVLRREDAVYKGKEMITRKTIINYAKTIIDFHNTYLVGKPISLTGDECTVKNFREIYKMGSYDAIDYKIIDHVNKYGDAYEVVYIEDTTIKSKILNNADCYPVYSDWVNTLLLLSIGQMHTVGSLIIMCIIPITWNAGRMKVQKCVYMIHPLMYVAYQFIITTIMMKMICTEKVYLMILCHY